MWFLSALDLVWLFLLLDSYSVFRHLQQSVADARRCVYKVMLRFSVSGTALWFRYASVRPPGRKSENCWNRGSVARKGKREVLWH